MIKHYRFAFVRYSRTLVLALFAALGLSFISANIASAATDPKYSISPGSYIEATGGFLTDESLTVPIFSKVDGKWQLNDSAMPDDAINFVNLSKPSVRFLYKGGNVYYTHVNYTTQDILSNGPLLPENRCYVGIKTNSSNTSGAFIGVNYKNEETSGCTQVVKNSTSLSSLNFSTASFNGEVLLDINIPTCKPPPATSTSQYATCVGQRNTALNQLGGKIGQMCSAGQAQNCTYYSSIKDCLEAESSRSVTQCKNREDALAILDGNFAAITADTTDKEIQTICKALPKNQQVKCIKSATKERDRLRDEGKTADPTTTCAVDGIGWIVCPLMNFMSSLNDLAFGFINNYLQIQPSLYSSKPVNQAWSAFRDIANVLFVIAFLIIVYSQLTGGGITNYGIKKILPKLFITAVLVNLSFVITALVIDISNILGASIYSLFETIDVGGGSGTGGTGLWAEVIGPVLAAGITVALLVAFVIGPAALLAFALIMLILIARQALIVLLVVIAPIAFVAYLLPNTEQWFKKYWKVLFGVVSVYVIVGFIFGASTMASNILFNVAGDDNQTLAIVALGTLAIPLFAVPIVLKGALSAAGSLGNKLASLQDSANRRASGNAKEKIKGYTGDAKNRWNMAAANNKLGPLGGVSRRRMRRDFLRSSREAEAKRSESVYTTGLTQGTGEQAQRYQRAAGGGIAGDSTAAVRASARATQQMHKQFDEDVSAFKTTLTGKSNEALVEMVKDTKLSSEQRAAAAGMIMARDHRESHLQALHAVGQASQQAEAQGNNGELEALSDIQKQMAHDMKDKPWALGDQAAGQLVNGVYGRSKNHENATQNQFGDIEKEIRDRVGTKLSAASLAKMNPDEMTRIQDDAIDNKLNDVQLKKLADTIYEARSNPQMNALIKSQEADKQQKILDYIKEKHPDIDITPPKPGGGSDDGTGGSASGQGDRFQETDSGLYIPR